jgi:hypothetical protein
LLQELPGNICSIAIVNGIIGIGIAVLTPRT